VLASVLFEPWPWCRGSGRCGSLECLSRRRDGDGAEQPDHAACRRDREVGGVPRRCRPVAADSPCDDTVDTESWGW